MAAGRFVVLRSLARMLSSSSAPIQHITPVAPAVIGTPGEVGVQEFLGGIGQGVELHADKVSSVVESVTDLLLIRSGKLKGLGIPCQQRKLILRYTDKYRKGVWRPKVGSM